MKVKILSACAALCACLSASGVSILAHGHGSNPTWTPIPPCIHHDENCDGWCDGCGYGFVDINGDGICDYYQQGLHQGYHHGDHHAWWGR